MMMMDSTEFAVSLSIAGIGIRLETNDNLFAQSLRSRYVGFLNPIEEHICLSIIVGSGSGSGGGSQRDAIIDKDDLRFLPYEDDNRVDFLVKKGKIRLVSQNFGEELEYLLRVITMFLAIRAGKMVVHAAGIVHHGMGYVFLGASGSGKSTVARRSPGDLVLNDDLVILDRVADCWVVQATPFTNPTQIKPSPSSSELKALFCLVKDNNNFIEKISSARGFAYLLASVPIVGLSEFYIKQVSEITEVLLSRIPIYNLHFDLTGSFWSAIEQI